MIWLLEGLSLGYYTSAITLVDWYSKHQSTVESATFGSEFTAACIAVDQIMDLHMTLCYLGVPVNMKSFMFGDNQAVVTNSTIPHYGKFPDKGVDGEVLDGYKKINRHMIYDIKHDGFHKSQYVASGHLEDPNEDSVYSGVVSLKGIHLTVLIAELNQLPLWGADVDNAYLEAKQRERCTSLQEVNLVHLKDIPCSLSRLCMDFNPLVFVGTKDLLM